MQTSSEGVFWLSDGELSIQLSCATEATEAAEANNLQSDTPPFRASLRFGSTVAGLQQYLQHTQ